MTSKTNPPMSRTEAVFVLKGGPEPHRETMKQVFSERGWKTDDADAGETGKATKGSKLWNVLFGAFAQYYEVSYEFNADDEGTALRVYRSTSGAMGGLIGASRVRKHFRAVAEEIEAAYNGQGVLIRTSVA